MNRSLEMWKEVTDASEDVSAPAKSTCSTVGKTCRHISIFYLTRVIFIIS